MEPTAPQTQTPPPAPSRSFVGRLKMAFRPTNGNLFANTTVKNRLLNFLDHYHAMVFLGLGAFLLLEMIWGITALQGSFHTAAVSTTLRQPAVLLPKTGLVHPSLAISANSQTFTIGKTYMAVITADAATEKTDGITAKIHYDPKAIQIVKVEPGKIFQSYVSPKIDPKAGTVTITGITDTTSYFTGTGMFADILFTPKAKGPTVLQLITARNGSASAIAAHKQNILAITKNLSLTIQ